MLRSRFFYHDNYQACDVIYDVYNDDWKNILLLS